MATVLTGCHASEPSAQTRRQIDRAVIAYTAGTLTTLPVQNCIDAEIRSAAMDDRRRTLESFSSDGRADRAVLAKIAAGEDLLWLLPEKPGQKPSEAAPSLKAELAKATVESLKTKPTISAAKRLIDKAAVSLPLIYMRNPVLAEGAKSVSGRHCPTIFAMAEPAVSDDIALVETSFVCGGLCGGGQIVALRRGTAGWTVVAIAPTWVS
ncbi:hypothetical protein [Novosphingobium resinovorum]|uniref:hypothetical protein n=1 Tax=Novosphingobium resinovorum TaxID=158500 RepID=UPI002ED58E40|nr:hypothetical protein [Novosphingobium resinovorum]